MIDDDIMGVNFVGGELLDQTLGLVQGQELGYTDTDECGLFLEKTRVFHGDVRLRPHGINNKWGTNRVFELTVDFRNHLTHGF